MESNHDSISSFLKVYIQSGKTEVYLRETGVPSSIVHIHLLPLGLHVRQGNGVSIVSGNGLSPIGQQAIIQTNAGLMLTEP